MFWSMAILLVWIWRDVFSKPFPYHGQQLNLYVLSDTFIEAKLTVFKAGITLKSKGDSGDYTAMGLYDALGDIYE